MMITTVYTRAGGSLRASVILFVIIWHSLLGWALISMDSSERILRPERTEKNSNIIQLELVTLSALPIETSKANSNLQLKEPLQPTVNQVNNLQPVANIITDSLLETYSAPKQSKTPVSKSPPIKESKKTVATIAKPEPSFATATPPKVLTTSKPSAFEPVTVKPAHIALSSDENATLANQQLVITELRKIAKQTVDDEPNLNALIQAVTKQFNRDQVQQQQAALRQGNRKRVEQEDLPNGANLLDETKISNESEQIAKIGDKAISFLEEQLNWRDEQAPLVSVPSQIWQNIKASSGDIFTVIVTLSVDKTGSITEVHILESSGNQIIDAIAMVQVRAGHLNPFQHDGIAVDAMVPMTLRYEMP